MYPEGLAAPCALAVRVTKQAAKKTRPARSAARQTLELFMELLLVHSLELNLILRVV
jgi:hypothetical protein